MARRRGDTVGKYQLAKLLSRPGAPSEVWAATDLTLGEAAALKIGAVPREAVALRVIEHPHIVKFLGQMQVEGEGGEPLSVLATELCATNLEDYLAPAEDHEKSDLRLETRIRFAREILEALCCLHQHGVVHNDLKPPNILLTGKREVRLADMGQVSGLSAQTSLDSVTGTMPGTETYRSPEQEHALLTGTSLIGAPTTDVFSCAVVFVRLFGVFRPQLNLAQKVEDIARGDTRDDLPFILSNASVPPALLAPLACALQYHPADRFPHAVAMAAACEKAFLEMLPPVEVAVGARTIPPRSKESAKEVPIESLPMSREPLWWVLGLAVCGGLVAAFWMHSSPAPNFISNIPSDTSTTRLGCNGARDGNDCFIVPLAASARTIGGVPMDKPLVVPEPMAEATGKSVGNNLLPCTVEARSVSLHPGVRPAHEKEHFTLACSGNIRGGLTFQIHGDQAGALTRDECNCLQRKFARPNGWQITLSKN